MEPPKRGILTLDRPKCFDVVAQSRAGKRKQQDSNGFLKHSTFLWILEFEYQRFESSLAFLPFLRGRVHLNIENIAEDS